MKGRKWFLNLIELVVLAGLVIFIVCMLRAGSSRDVSLDELRDTLLRQEGITDLMEKDASGIYAAFSLVPEEALYWKTDEIMDVRELLIVKSKNLQELEQVQAAVEEHLKTQIDNFTGYGADQVAVLEHAVLLQKGDYYFYAVGDQVEAWQETFLSLVS